MSSDLNATNVTFKHAVEVYRAASKKAKIVKPIDLLEYGYPVGHNEDNIRLFTGLFTEISEKLKLSPTQRANALKILGSMNCITKIRNPGGGSPGVWILNYEPTVEQWIQYKETNLRILRKTMPSKADTIITQLKELIIKVNEIDKLAESLGLLERRVSELENKWTQRSTKLEGVPDVKN